MALLLHCKSGVVRVNGEPVTGTTFLPEGSVIEPLAESQFEVLLAETIAETLPSPPSSPPPIRADFPPNVFLREFENTTRETRRWLLQTPDGTLQFVGTGFQTVPAT